MDYRALGKSDYKASVVGLGAEHLEKLDYPAIERVISAAIECGMNLTDVFMSEPNVRSNIGKALTGRREKMMLQGHIGAGYKTQYYRAREVDECKFFFEDFMTRLNTDYVDIGMLHYVDTTEDFEKVFSNGMTDYALQLKKEGRIRLIGMSSHDPVNALKAVKTGIIDVLMFSINPAYDLLPEDTDIDSLFVPETYKQALLGSNPVRAELYRECENRGVGITVMKSLGGGSLLNAAASPFGIALTPEQCIHYALTRPAVSSVLVGAKTPEEVYAAAAYCEKSAEEKDYSVLLSNTPKYSLKGRCMYCNHCLPCPSGIDIASVNKYYDLLTMNDAQSVRGHYEALAHTAADCIACGSCMANCPFDVDVISRMEAAKALFGK